MAVDDVYKATINQTLASATVENILYWKIVSTDDDLSDIKALSLLIPGQILVPWRGLVSDEVSFDCIELQNVFPGTPDAVQMFDLATTGTKAGEALPGGDTLLFQKINNATSGKGKKGRLYMAGPIEADISQGRVSAALFALMQSFADIFEDSIDNATNFSAKPVWAVRVGNFIQSTLDVDIMKPLPRTASQIRRRTPIRSSVP